MKSEKEYYKYNSIYKFFVNALQFDPPQPPFKRGEPRKYPFLKDNGGYSLSIICTFLYLILKSHTEARRRRKGREI